MRWLLWLSLGAACSWGCDSEETGERQSSTATTSSTSSSGVTTSSTGGGGSGSGGFGGAGGAGGACTHGAVLELTSTVVADMGLLPVDHKCTAFPNGQNISPPLAWTSGPAETMSYAVIFRDISGPQPFLHSAIWDIPACIFELPEDVEKTPEPSEVPGAKQCRAYNGQFGYEGPCAPADPNPRPYQFEIYAIGAATLPGVTTDSTLADVQAAVQANSLASATLTVIDDEP